MMLKMDTRIVDGITVLDCNGRIVFGEETSALRDMVTKLSNETRQILLNLGGVTYIDSGGLGTLVALYTSAQRNGATMKLANLTQRVGDLMQITKLFTVFEVYDNEEQALKAFQRGAAA